MVLKKCNPGGQKKQRVQKVRVKNGVRGCVQWSALGVFKIRRRVWESGTECYECVVLMCIRSMCCDSFVCCVGVR